jgi:hypothetical protein
MAITQPALARAMARDVVRAAPPEAGIKRIWVWSQHGYIDPERDYVELAVLHGPMNDETLHRFLAAVTKMTDERYPEANMFMHTFSSDDVGDLDLEGEIRPGSEEVELGAE